MEQTAKDLVNQLLDSIREQHNLHSDAALARYLNVNQMSIVRWRRGEIAPSTKVLLPQALAHGDILRSNVPVN
jgi:DNA-binding transcriptional regulator YiaG